VVFGGQRGNITTGMGARWSRRLLVGSAGAVAAGGLLRWGVRRAARAAPPTVPLSEAAKALIERAWQGLAPAQVLDGHVHVVGLGVGGTGCAVSPRARSWAHPAERLKFEVYLSAAGVSDEADADAQYVAALTRAADTARHGRFLLFAFDQAYADDGQVLLRESEFFTPNWYVSQLARARPDLFVAAASVHPYRRDAVDALEEAVAAGAVAVKWLPNAMNIDPSSAQCDAFYAALERLKVPLISHAGEEKAVHAEERQRLGNPLHLRRPLEKGVTVVVAHCASLGENPDLDNPSGAWVDNFDLFVRLMREPQWQGRLFGEISAVTLVNRVGPPLLQLLRDASLASRLVNGSDYPLPAINALLQTRPLVSLGLLTEDERAALNEIDAHNPLLYDFALKRTLALREGAVEKRFLPSTFTLRPEVFSRLV
jgi:uncharacterized protein